MARTCEHSCCSIRGNPYHLHERPPERCLGCSAADGEPSGEVSLGELVAEVVARVAPEIPGLPTGRELVEQITAETRAVHAAAAADPVLAGVPAAERHTVLAGRVGLALAFGHRWAR
jgi:hypothetical protein